MLLDTLGLRQIKQKFRLAKSLPAVSCNNSVGLDHASSGLLMSNHVGLDHVSCHNLCSGIVSNHSLLQFGFVIEHLEFAFLVTTAPHVILLVAFVTQAII